MRIAVWVTFLGAVVVSAACGSKPAASTGETAGGPNNTNSSFSGTGTQNAQACQVDADCDRHDPCLAFFCKKDMVEVSVGTCVYTLGDGGGGCGVEDAGDAGPYIIHDDAGTDAIAPSDDAGDAGGGATCDDALSVEITSVSGPGCILDTTVGPSSPATLTFPCVGGAADVTFGAQTFAGTVSNGDVSVTNVDVYTFVTTTNLKCKYETTQTISGTLGSGQLAYTYSEALEPGQPPLCAFETAPCSASGTVTVH